MSGFVTPGDVLAYRRTWDGYVLGIARAELTCAAAWRAGQGDTSGFAVPPSASVIESYASGFETQANAIMTQWNAHAGLSDADIVIRAADILTYQQTAIMNVVAYSVQDLQRYCPKIVLPPVPSFDLQSEVIGRIEGLGILSHGVLQLIGVGAGGALDTYQQIGTKALSAGEKVGSILSSPWPWIAVGLVALAYGAGVIAPLIPKHSSSEKSHG
jgi:hypothetical protein